MYLANLYTMSTESIATESPANPLPAPPLPGVGQHWALFLDVDGTLLDFNDDPRAVVVTPAMLTLLHALHRALDGALALVSGRDLDDLDVLFGRPKWAAAGLHGLQLRQANGSFRRLTLPAAQQAKMHASAIALAAQFEGVQVENKQLAVALHYHGESEQLRALRDAAAAMLVDLPGYELQPGYRVVEIKPSGMDKGRAVAQLLRHAPFAGRLPVYLGDDLTDEHGFASVNRRQGLSVRIGARVPTRAAFTLSGPAAAEAWLARVLFTLTNGNPSHDALPGGTAQPS